MEQKRLYPDMTAEEQLTWVTDFEALMKDGGDRIVAEARKRQPQWQQGDAQTVRRLVGMLAVWPFAQDFCDKAQRYGDYMARAVRLPVYIDKAKERLADGLTMTDADGRTVAYVSSSTPLRRRGRPSREETAAKLRGETVSAGPADDAEARKRRIVARMLGLEVVSGEAPREKNNAELAADRAARRKEYERQNPSLFGAQAPTAAAEEQPPKAQTPPAPLACPTMAEIYQQRIEQDRLRLSDLAWLCSDELRQRIPTVRSLRVTAESSSERAKTMAELNKPASAIEPYAQQAKEATEAYLAIYAAVDDELAVLFKRLSLDEPFLNRFKGRFRGVDIEKVLHICRPYYEKVKDQERQRGLEMSKKGELTIDERIRLLIERDNPEYAEKMKAEEEKKQEVTDILRYLKRRDKMATDVRLKSAKEVKFPRLVELIGEKEAMNYYPLITYIEEENRKLHEADGKGKVSETGNSQEKDKDTKFKKPAKKKSDKQKTEKKKDGQ